MSIVTLHDLHDAKVVWEGTKVYLLPWWVVICLESKKHCIKSESGRFYLIGIKLMINVRRDTFGTPN